MFIIIDNRGYKDIKDEISSSLKVSDIFGLIFY